MDANLVADWWWTVWFDILFTISQLPNLHPCWRIHTTKCVQRTIARNQGFSRHAQPPLGLWLPTLQYEWINILLRTPSIWFLLDRNALRFSLHLSESAVKEIQKTKRSVIVHFFYLLVASLRFSLVSLCVHFVFSAAALHFLVRWMSRLIAL